MNSYNHCFSHPKVYIRGWYSWIFPCVHIVWLLVSWQIWEIISWAWFSAKFLIERAPSHHAYIWPDYDRGPFGQVLKSRFSGFFIITTKFLIDRVPSCPILKISDLGRIGELATGEDGHGTNTQNIPGADTFRRISHMFHSDSRNSSVFKISAL
jgi:hypothetical protein